MMIIKKILKLKRKIEMERKECETDKICNNMQRKKTKKIYKVLII